MALLSVVAIGTAAACVTTIHNGPVEEDSCNGTRDEQCSKTFYSPPVPGCVELTINTGKDCSWDGEYSQGIKTYDGLCSSITALTCITATNQLPYSDEVFLWAKPKLITCVSDGS